MIDLDFLERLIRTLDESGIDHIEIERGGTRIRVSKTPVPLQARATADPPVAVAPSAGAAQSSLPSGSGGGEAPGAAGDPAGARAPLPENYVEITSPMVGTFYRTPAPDSDPFTDVGRRITKGDPLCIIEAMKLMNELEADVDGTVREICVANGEPVEYGQVLFRVELG